MSSAVQRRRQLQDADGMQPPHRNRPSVLHAIPGCSQLSKRFSAALGMEVTTDSDRHRDSATSAWWHGDTGIELKDVLDNYSNEVLNVMKCPNGAAFVSLCWSAASMRFPVAVADVRRHHRTVKMSSACFLGFVALELLGFYFIFAVGEWHTLHPLQSIILCAVSACANALYVALGGGVGGSRLASADPGFISPDGREVDVPLIIALRPAWQGHHGDTAEDEDASPKSILAPVMCRTCCRVRPIRAKHCHDCGRCVGRFDHHCHWLGTCVAGRNRLLFLMLLVAMLGAIGFGLVLLLMVHSHTTETPQCGSFCRASMVAVMVFGVGAFLLVLFTALMQVGAMNENSSSYELFYTDDAVMTIIDPRTGKRVSVQKAFQFAGSWGFGNVAQYFAQWTQRGGEWDCINAGKELLLPLSQQRTGDDNRKILVRTVL